MPSSVEMGVTSAEDLCRQLSRFDLAFRAQGVGGDVILEELCASVKSSWSLVDTI
jgi:hypothetical protein